MDRADVIRWAQEAAAQHGHTIKATPEIMETLTSFAALAYAAGQAAERERIGLASKAGHTHDCRRCHWTYTPAAGESEDCPKCGHDGRGEQDKGEGA